MPSNAPSHSDYNEAQALISYTFNSNKFGKKVAAEMAAKDIFFYEEEMVKKKPIISVRAEIRDGEICFGKDTIRGFIKIDPEKKLTPGYRPVDAKLASDLLTMEDAHATGKIQASFIVSSHEQDIGKASEATSPLTPGSPTPPPGVSWVYVWIQNKAGELETYAIKAPGDHEELVKFLHVMTGKPPKVVVLPNGARTCEPQSWDENYPLDLGTVIQNLWRGKAFLTPPSQKIVEDLFQLELQTPEQQKETLILIEQQILLLADEEGIEFALKKTFELAKAAFLDKSDKNPIQTVLNKLIELNDAIAKSKNPISDARFSSSSTFNEPQPLSKIDRQLLEKLLTALEKKVEKQLERAFLPPELSPVNILLKNLETPGQHKKEPIPEPFKPVVTPFFAQSMAPPLAVTVPLPVKEFFQIKNELLARKIPDSIESNKNRYIEISSHSNTGMGPLPKTFVTTAQTITSQKKYAQGNSSKLESHSSIKFDRAPSPGNVPLFAKRVNNQQGQIRIGNANGQLEEKKYSRALAILQRMQKTLSVIKDVSFIKLVQKYFKILVTFVAQKLKELVKTLQVNAQKIRTAVAKIATSILAVIQARLIQRMSLKKAILAFLAKVNIFKRPMGNDKKQHQKQLSNLIIKAKNNFFKAFSRLIKTSQRNRYKQKSLLGKEQPKWRALRLRAFLKTKIGTLLRRTNPVQSKKKIVVTGLATKAKLKIASLIKKAFLRNRIFSITHYKTPVTRRKILFTKFRDLWGHIRRTNKVKTNLKILGRRARNQSFFRKSTMDKIAIKVAIKNLQKRHKLKENEAFYFWLCEMKRKLRRDSYFAAKNRLLILKALERLISRRTGSVVGRVNDNVEQVCIPPEVEGTLLL